MRKVEMLKRCKECNLEKELVHFQKKKGGKHGVVAKCKPCVSEYRKTPAYRAKERNEPGKRKPSTEEFRAKARERNRKYKKTEQGKDYFIGYNVKRYGLTVSDYKKMLKDQDDKCLICFKHQDDLSRRLAVDHCHETGKVRGLLCSPCNAALGGFGDSVDMLERAIRYLKF